MKIIEVTNDQQNWGKFMLFRMGVQEWARKSTVEGHTRDSFLLNDIGWNPRAIWVLDLQTREGAAFSPGGLAKADLNKHKIWVCPMFEPFLEWLYKQDVSDLSKLPNAINLPDAPFAYEGYRRSGE